MNRCENMHGSTTTPDNKSYHTIIFFSFSNMVLYLSFVIMTKFAGGAKTPTTTITQKMMEKKWKQNRKKALKEFRLNEEKISETCMKSTYAYENYYTGV